jgi:hypothetical protein
MIDKMLMQAGLLAIAASSGSASAPAPKAGELTVRAEIVGRGEPCGISGRCKKAFFVRLEMRNQTPNPVQFNQMKCDWTASWLVDGPYEMRVGGCDGNYATTLTLEPGQAMLFYGTLCSNQAFTKPQLLRVAFVALELSEVTSSFSAAQLAAYATAQQRPVFWSNVFTDDFWNDSYRLIEQ